MKTNKTQIKAKHSFQDHVNVSLMSTVLVKLLILGLQTKYVHQSH